MTSTRLTLPPRTPVARPTMQSAPTAYRADPVRRGEHLAAIRLERERCYDLAVAQAGASPVLVAKPSARNVNELVTAYSEWARAHYVKAGRPTGTGPTNIRAVKLLVESGAGEIPIDRFGPLMLIAYQQWLVAKSDRPLVRNTINQYVQTVVGMFQWAVSRELVSASVWASLKAVPPLRKGRAPSPGLDAPVEGRRVHAVPAEVLEATRKRVSVIIRDMIDVQAMTAMRPAEICAMRLVDLHQGENESIAYYRVTSDANKVDHHDIQRVVALGPRTLEILAPYIARATKLRADRSYLFRPVDAVKAALVDKHARRVVPIGYGNSPGTNRVEHPKWTPGERYTVSSYRRAISRGCTRAKVTKWSPNQLRHNGASAIANATSLEVACEQLGHKSIKTTMIYVEPDRSRLIKWAKEHA